MKYAPTIVTIPTIAVKILLKFITFLFSLEKNSLYHQLNQDVRLLKLIKIKEKAAKIYLSLSTYPMDVIKQIPIIKLGIIEKKNLNFAYKTV